MMLRCGLQGADGRLIRAKEKEPRAKYKLVKCEVVKGCRGEEVQRFTHNFIYFFI